MLFKDEIYKLYDKTTYFDKYGGMIMISGCILLVWFSLFTYFNLKTQFEPIRKDWVNRKCDPQILPISGFINAPPGVSPFKYTKDNFNECLFNIFGASVGGSFGPAFSASGNLLSLFSIFTDILGSFRQVINYFRERLYAIFNLIFSKINNFIIPLRKMVMALKGILLKLQAVFVTVLYTLITLLFQLQSALGAKLQLIIGLVVNMALFIPFLWIFMWPVAIIYTIFWVVVVVFAIIIGITLYALLSSLRGKDMPNYFTVD